MSLQVGSRLVGMPDNNIAQDLVRQVRPLRQHGASAVGPAGAGSETYGSFYKLGAYVSTTDVWKLPHHHSRKEEACMKAYLSLILGRQGVDFTQELVFNRIWFSIL